MTISEKIQSLYPTLTSSDFYTVIRLQNDGDERGDYIAEWNHPTIALPTDEQLAAAA